MSIRQIFEMPAMVQTEGTEDYNYPSEYTNQLCKLGDKYVLFKEKNYEEFPTTLIDIVLQAAAENQTEAVTEDQVDMKLSDIISDIHSNTMKVDENINNFKTNTNESIYKVDRKVQEVMTQVGHLQSPEKIKAIVSKELTSVYENYEKVMKKLIEEKAQELAKDIKDAGNKLQPMDVMMYKKMGMELQDIISLAKSGLI
jgi:hypothetical protein